MSFRPILQKAREFMSTYADMEELIRLGAYRKGSDPKVDRAIAINPQFEWTGGGIASTTADLARWAKLLYEGKAFPPEQLRRMLDGVPARLGRNTRYGLAVILRDTPLGATYGHSGFFPGYATEILEMVSLRSPLASRSAYQVR